MIAPEAPTALDSRHSTPNAKLQEILVDNGLGHGLVDYFCDWAYWRQATIHSARAEWLQSDFTNTKALTLIVMGHTIEAMQAEPDADFLQTSIGDVLTHRAVRPTLDFVTPKVADLLDDATAACYVENMLAEPGYPFLGWAPLPTEHQIIERWQLRFADSPHLTQQLRTHQAYLNRPLA